MPRETISSTPGKRFIVQITRIAALSMAAMLISMTVVACGGEGEPEVIVEQESLSQGNVVVTVAVEKHIEVESTPSEPGIPGEPGSQRMSGKPDLPKLGAENVATVVVENEIVVKPIATVAVEKHIEVESLPGEPGIPGKADSKKMEPKNVVVEKEHVLGTGSAPSNSSNGASSYRAPQGTTFQDYARSQFVRTEQDDTATFSLDTDRTSYQLALNWARAGYEIDPDSVRAEEWINAFEYGYKAPRNSDSFNIYADLFPHPIDRDKHIARIAFQAPDTSDNLPLNVTLVLDASGSMADGNRVAIAREAAQTLRRTLRAQDRISVVQFSETVLHHLVIDNAHPDDDQVSNSIQALAPNASTNVQAGLDRGVELAHGMRLERPDALNYIILMSDGVANVDATNPFAILETAGDSDADNPLRLITIGVGISNYNDYLLEQLAQHGNGWYRYLSSAAEANALFARDRWLKLSSPFADQTRAQVRWDPEHVDSWRLIGYENRVTSDESFTQPLKKFAELPSGAATTVFFELELKDRYGALSSVDALGAVEVRWTTPISGASNHQHAEIRNVLDYADDMGIFGAIVALSADRYSARNEASIENQYHLRSQIDALREELRGMNTQFAGTDAFMDFNFLINHIGDALEKEPEAPSGYSS